MPLSVTDILLAEYEPLVKQEGGATVAADLRKVCASAQVAQGQSYQLFMYLLPVLTGPCCADTTPI